MTHYFYLFEDGTVALSKEPPTDVDIQCVKLGCLTVIRSDGYSLAQDGYTFEPLAEAVRKDSTEGQYTAVESDD